ncbi:MAG TPA: glucuronyl hydrolase, partial [Chitinophagaceae bacterium]|nr:glucuronyl hydrolase [Chitinophagaceae bacterium]
MNQTNRIYILALAVLLTGCAASKSSIKPKKNLLRMIDTSFINASAQYRLMMKNLPADRFPKTYIAHNDEFRTAPSGDWCSGFYPGTLFYLYEQTKDTLLLLEAERKLNVLEKEKNNRSTHDLG